MTRRAVEADRTRRDAEAEVDAELGFHRALTIEELVAAGLAPEAAEAEARRRFGPAPLYRARLIDLDRRIAHAERRRIAMSLIVTSVRAVVRDIRRAPGFTLGVVAMLTLGLGVNAITFGLVDRLVLSGPAGITAPGELRRVVEHRRSRTGAEVAATELGYLDYQDLRRADLLAGAAAESESALLYGSGESAERIQGLLVTGNYFPLLGVTPALGRFFSDDESAREGARVAVLGYAFWQSRFGGDPAVLGQSLLIETHRYTVVGVAPRYFTGSSVARRDVFLPLEAASDEQVEGPWRTSRNFRWIGAIVRLAPGASAAAAADQATTIHRQGYADVPGADAQSRLEFAPLNAVSGATASGEMSVAGLVGGVALLVLVIAVANTANLFLARALRRRDAIALRLALGGARSRLIAEQAGEGALLALIGAGVAVGVAWLGGPAVQRLLFPQVAWLDSAVDVRLLVVLGLAAVAGGAIAAALPMWQAGRADVAAWLKTGVQRGAASRTRTQVAMLVVQGALSVLLLVGAGLFMRSLARAQSIDLGLDTDRLLVLSVLRGPEPASPDLNDRIRAAVERIPGVEATTRIAGTLSFVSSWAETTHVPGLAERPRVDDGGPYLSAVEPNYFTVAGTSIVEGRAFTDADRQGAPRVAVVSRRMAQLYWPGASALGRCIEVGDQPDGCYTVVGVANDTRRQALVEGDTLRYYLPLDQAPADLRRGGRLLIRATDADLDTLGRIAETTRRETLAIAPTLRYVAARNLDDVVAPQLRAWRLGAGLFGVFGLLALVVASLGLYAVVLFNVEGRRREMGLRAALGATAGSLLGLVVRDGLRAAAGGVALGLAIAWIAAPAVASLLFQIPPRDPAVFAGVAASLLGAAALASAIPGLRAGRVEPSRALRDE
ncbi:MAG: ABC transporter permease [Vicinamibacterales bacterium]